MSIEENPSCMLCDNAMVEKYKYFYPLIDNTKVRIRSMCYNCTVCDYRVMNTRHMNQFLEKYRAKCMEADQI